MFSMLMKNVIIGNWRRTLGRPWLSKNKRTQMKWSLLLSLFYENSLFYFGIAFDSNSYVYFQGFLLLVERLPKGIFIWWKLYMCKTISHWYQKKKKKKHHLTLIWDWFALNFLRENFHKQLHQPFYVCVGSITYVCILKDACTSIKKCVQKARVFRVLKVMKIV